MMKLLHSADWHLDSPLAGRSPELAQHLREESRKLPERVVALARENQCQLLLLAGDLFDGPCTQESLTALRQALAGAGMPVLIAPGNHDPLGPGSPWQRELWPENVRIFSERVDSVVLSSLSCRVYGAGFSSQDSPALLEGFHAQRDMTYTLGVFHGDPTQGQSPYNPVSDAQVTASGLDYLALGHIHKGGSFRKGETLCAWPGCPMGRGFDELGPKGVLLVTLDPRAEAQFLPLGMTAFYDLSVEAGPDPAAALARSLPAAGSSDVYRVTFTGECAGLDLGALTAAFPQFPYLQLQDRTLPPLDIWGSAGEDTLEGLYFSLLHRQTQDPATAQAATLAARISRQLLSGREVPLP